MRRPTVGVPSMLQRHLGPKRTPKSDSGRTMVCPEICGKC